MIASRKRMYLFVNLAKNLTVS